MSTGFVAPPLPPGWTEHIGPGGQAYYYNSMTQESTYVRPLPAFPITAYAPPAPAPEKKKKEKPMTKTPIPGTEWLRVRTTEGNVFYTHKGRKESVWVVPEEIKEAVQTLEEEEKAREENAKQQKEDAEEKDIQMDEEMERIKKEVQRDLEKAKRKAEEEPVPLVEMVATKKTKLEDAAEEEGADEDEDQDEESEDSEEEEWQKEAAAQLAQEAEEERRRIEEEKAQAEKEKEEAKLKEKESRLNMPERVDLSIDEAKALFKTLLREKDVNPLHPWDTSLPLFISDPRYVLLPSVSARKEAFDEYCRERVRERRQNTVKADKAAAENPKDIFERLLKEEVKSTRTSWTDFRRTWKKDRRFYGWGKDDREREKRFRAYLKELGEEKRLIAQKNEANFFALLKGSGLIKADSVWKDVKRKLSSDPRYDAVGSSSLREELFNTYIKALKTSTVEDLTKSHDPSPSTSKALDEGQKEKDEATLRKERKERAVKEREEKVRQERDRLEAAIDKSKTGLNREEDEQAFRTMLTDAVRDPKATWDGMLSQLKTDPRFTRCSLPINQQIHLFNSHVGQLRAKQLTALRNLFQVHAPGLDVEFSQLPLTSIMSSPPVIRLGFNERETSREFDVWQRERTNESHVAFDEMMKENSFVEFWGRLGKLGGEGVDGGLKIENDDIEDEGVDETKVDMKSLAKNIDVTEIIKVLKNDKRYTMFDHAPEQRDKWIRDYLSQLSAPSLSVHTAS